MLLRLINYRIIIIIIIIEVCCVNLTQKYLPFLYLCYQSPYALLLKEYVTATSSHYVFYL